MLRTSPEIVTTIILGVALLMMLSIIVGLLIFHYKSNQQRHVIDIQRMQLEFEKHLTQSQVEVQEATFAAVAKELHDNVGQLLSTAKMLVGITERRLAQPPDTLMTAHETLGKALQELRSLSKSLTNEWLGQFDLIENLSAELRRLSVAGDLVVQFEEKGSVPLPNDQQIILFRVMQESIQNVVKHAHAANLIVSVLADDQALRILIRDDGIGFLVDGQVHGIGLMNVKHRIRLLNGQISWLSAPGQGTEVHIILPLNDHKDAKPEDWPGR